MNAYEFLQAKDKHDAESFALKEATPQSPRLSTADGSDDRIIEAWINPASTHTPAMIVVSCGKRECQFGHAEMTFSNASSLRDWLLEVLPKEKP